MSFFDSKRCLIIGEVAQAHDGSLGTAHAYIDAIADAGADAVKFQTHIAACESTAREPWRVKFSKQDDSRFGYWRRMEFTEPQWHELAAHAKDRGLQFWSSPFSSEAVELLKRVGVAGWKIASGEVRSDSILNPAIATKMPVILSSGMSGLTDLDAAVAKVKAGGCPMAVLQCTTAYPCPPEKIGLNVLPFLRDRYGCASGLSDHSGTIYPGLAAVAQGCEVLEVHVTFSREMFGPDVPASVTTAELRELTDGIRQIETMKANPIDKDTAAGDMGRMRAIFGKSIVARTDLAAGTVVSREALAYKKPGDGLAEWEADKILNRKLKTDRSADDLLLEEHFE